MKSRHHSAPSHDVALPATASEGTSPLRHASLSAPAHPDSTQFAARSPGADAVGPERQRPGIHWPNLCFLVALHLVGSVGLLAYLSLHGVTAAAVAIGIVGVALTNLAISLGYHRLFSHRAYETGPVVRFLLLVLGAGAFQNSALAWAADHRRHHRHIDTDKDPYNAKRGLLYSHIGWVLERQPPATDTWPAPDLEKSRLVRWQHRYYPLIGAVSGFLLPALVGWLAGDWMGGLLFGGLLRLIVSYHATFCINSLAHRWGTQPYSQRDTSRDSWLSALFTMGEGYHNYHHTFPNDYRNGVRLHQLDPSKWVLFGLERLGLAWSLRRTPSRTIARARVRTALARVERQGIPPRLRPGVERAHQALEATLAQWAAASRACGAKQTGSPSYRELHAECQVVKKSFQQGYRRWRSLLRRVELESASAGAA